MPVSPEAIRIRSDRGRRRAASGTDRELVRATGGAGRSRRAADLDRGGRRLFSGTPSACAGLSSTSTSPRSTIRTARSSPRSCGPAGSRAGAPGSTAGCRFTARARRAICIRSSTCSIPGWRPGRRSTSTRSCSIWLTGLGTYRLAAPARPAGRGPDRRRHLRAGRLHLGAPGPHQHDQRAGERAVRHLGPGMVVGAGRWRGVVLGAFALACQVFAGHLQDVLLTSGIVGFYGLYRAGHRRRRAQAAGTTSCMAAGLVVLGVLLSAVQWIPSKGAARSITARRGALAMTT